MGSELIVALVLGLTGSLGHCFGMCGGISLMLGAATPDRKAPIDARVVVANLGRVTTYAGLGAVAGFVGEVLTTAMPGVRILQGGLALLAAAFAVYAALALLGRAPSPDILLRGLTGRWGELMQRTFDTASRVPYLTGLVWGFIPCGLVLVAVVAAASTGHPVAGAAVMTAFGVGTVPAMLGVGSLGRLFGRAAGDRRASNWGVVAAAVVALFGIQMALRGLAAWDLVGHVMIGDLVLW